MPAGDPVTVVTATCANCGAVLAGEYCHGCGQRPADGDELTVRHAARTAADEILHLESKTLRSVARLFTPGFLTAAYLAGHRVRYTSPVKLYLACAAIFFLLAPFAGFALEDMLASDPSGTIARWVAEEVARKGLHRDLFVERFDLRFQTVYTVSLFLSVIGGAAMLAFLFRRQRRPFGAHIVFELHYVSFLYLATLIVGFLLERLPSMPLASLLATLAVLAPYLYLALRRVYREPVGRTLLKALAMIAFALLLDGAVNFLALVATLALV